MYPMLVHAHSGLRWLVLIFLVLAIINAFSKWRSGAAFTPSDKRKGLFALIFSHLQFVIGLGLYFISPRVNYGDMATAMSDKSTRFFTVEHLSLMILALVLITIGYSKAKRNANDTGKFKTTFWFYFIGLILILAGIPWPFLGYGTGWF